VLSRSGRARRGVFHGNDGIFFGLSLDTDTGHATGHATRDSGRGTRDGARDSEPTLHGKAIAAAFPGPYAVGQVRRIVVLVLTLIVLGPTAASAATWYRCAHDGVLRAACCCPSQTGHHTTPVAPDPAPRARQACCCNVINFVARPSSVRSAPPIAAQVAPAIAMIEAPATPPLEVPRRAVALEPPRAPRGPPDLLFVRHCSLLL